MAAITFLAAYGANGDIEVVTPVLGEVPIPSGEVGVIIQDGVETFRRVEIIGAVRWLMRGLKNRNILQQFALNVKGRRDASCLFLSSVCAVRQIVPGVSAYAAAKAGLEGLVKAAAPELARNGARVNAIRMGYFDAGMKNTIPAEVAAQIKDTIPLKQWGECGHLLNLIKTTLINTYMTGSIVDITGGL